MDRTEGIIIFGLIGLGLLFVLSRSRGAGYSEDAGYAEESIPLRLTPSSRATGVHQYTNKETWDIEWNEDGLPKRVTIHREAVQT